jgi:enoyl-CoA hydratase/carnithine racemase
MALVDQYEDSRVSVITLNDAEHGNLLGPQRLDELAGAIERSRKDPRARAILLRSNGPTFCLGMDLGRLASSAPKTSAAEAETAISRYADVLHSLFASPLPVVCHVQGEVKAGGVGLACACDVVVSSEEASFELGEVIFGLIPANVLPYVLSLRMPPQKARYLVLSSQRISAAEALRLNLVDEVVSARNAEHRLREIFRRLLCSSPRALAAAKEFTAELIGKTPEQGGELARGRLLELMIDPSTIDGVRAFQEGHVPSWFTRFKPLRPLADHLGVAEKEGER